jgi:mono/diheme cytochrome c family protein
VSSNFKYIAALAAFYSVTIAQSLFAQQSSNEFGNELLRQRCASCHAISVTDQSRHSSAPAFRDIVKRYKPELLAEALAEGILTGHPDMPVIAFQPHEVGAIVQYLEQLSKEPR